jgi:hypothetical protein
MGQGIPVLGPDDAALAIDADGNISVSSSPGGEPVTNAINGTTAKYLNFGREGSGFIVTPASIMLVESFQITTANDAEARDPATWQLFGFNGTLLSTNHSTGLAESWTLIDSGPVALPAARNTLGPLVDVNLAAVGGVGFEHYKMYFPTLKNAPGTNSMQIAEIQFYNDNLGVNAVLAPSNPILAINERTAPNSSYPAGESPARTLDQVATTKYLNFGRENSGIIVTNAGGPVTVQALGLTTANDWPGRDPGSFELYGTNDDIISTDNSDGNGGENWTRIAIGDPMLPGDPQVSNDGRFMHVVIPIVHEAGPAAYGSYKLVFPTLKNAAAPNVNSMQIADIQLYAIPEPAALALVAMAGLAMSIVRRARD